MQLVMQNEMNNLSREARDDNAEKVESPTFPEIEIPPRPESDLDLFALHIFGGPIRRAFLEAYFFEVVESPISSQIIALARLAVHLHMGARRLHQIVEEAGAASNSNEINFKLTQRRDCARQRIATSIADDRVLSSLQRLRCSLIPYDGISSN
jgi:hypothetical protein